MGVLPGFSFHRTVSFPVLVTASSLWGFGMLQRFLDSIIVSKRTVCLVPRRVGILRIWKRVLKNSIPSLSPQSLELWLSTVVRGVYFRALLNLSSPWLEALEPLLLIVQQYSKIVFLPCFLPVSGKTKYFVMWRQKRADISIRPFSFLINNSEGSFWFHLPELQNGDDFR